MPAKFTWVPEAARFRGANGQWVPRGAVTGALNRVIQRSENRVRVGANAYRKGKITGDDFQLLLRTELKQTHIAAYAAGKGGFKQLTKADYGRLGSVLKKQYAYLDRFMADLAAGEVTLDGRFLQRAMLYVKQARTSYYLADRASQEVAGMTQEHNVKANADNCEGCLEATAMGWVSLGTLTPVGERDCLGNCLCTIEYRK